MIIVSEATRASVVSAAGAERYSGKVRATRKTPAATIVAAWISAEIGVGPGIASGNHVWNGNWADLPMTATATSTAGSHSSSRAGAVSTTASRIVVIR